jgi:hypothetical protein
MAKKAASKTTTKKVNSEASKAVEVKKTDDVVKAVNDFIFKSFHDRYNFSLSTNVKESLVAYGPWIAAALLLLFAPEMLVLAKTAQFISFSGFLEQILFSKDSWVILVVVFINCLAVADSLSYLFKKSKRGWNAVYGALLVNLIYVVYQLFSNLDHPAAPILSVIGLGACIFTLLDIRTYYK